MRFRRPSVSGNVWSTVGLRGPLSAARPGLLVLSMYYRPEPNFITADVAEALARDYDVTVVTAHPNYPLGRFYDGVRAAWWPRRTAENGVTVWRLPLVPYHGNSITRRAMAYLSFAVVACLLAPLVGGRPATVWVYQTPFTTALAALWFRFVRHSRVVFTCVDLWPESLLAANVVTPGPLVRALFAYRRWINREAESIVTSTRGMARQFVAEGVPPERVHFVPVWVELPEALPAVVSTEEETVPSIVYAGNLGPAQQLETLVRAGALLAQQQVSVTIDLYGTGSSAADLRTLAASLGADNVRFHGRVTPAEALAVSRRAAAQVVILRRSPLFDLTVPSKLAFCLAAGAPLLSGLSGEAAEIAMGAGSIAFDPDDPESLAASIRTLLALPAHQRQALRLRHRACYEKTFTRSRLLDRYREVLAVPESFPARRRRHSESGV